MRSDNIIIELYELS